MEKNISSTTSDPSPVCFFVSDLHGRTDRYQKLFTAIADERPAALFLGGDLLPSGLAAWTAFDVSHKDFINDFLVVEFKKLQRALGADYPRVFLILGNDDGRFPETTFN